MSLTNAFKAFAVSAALLSLTGCASIMSGPNKRVRIESTPPGAHVSVRTQDGLEVASLTTPAIATLPRKSAWFLPARYVATIEKPGFQSINYKISPYMNPWWFPGNVVFGGLIGFVIIDPLTGAMYGLSPSEIHAVLPPAPCNRKMVD